MTGRKRDADVLPDAPFKKAKSSDIGIPTSHISPSTAYSDEDASIADTTVTSHSTSRRRPKKYACTFEDCGKAFDRPVKLEAHTRTHTDDRAFVCNEDGCTKAFFKAEHLKAHVKNKHSSTSEHLCGYVVTITDDGEKLQCGKAFTTSSRLKRHMAMHEKHEEFRCDHCGQTFRKMDTLQRHIRKDHLNELAFVCRHSVFHFTDDGEEMEEECGQAFPTSGQLRTHSNREHSGNRYFCDECTIPPLSQVSLDTTFDAVAERPSFRTWAELQAHFKAVHPPLCTICGKSCISSRDLTAHMDIEHDTTLDDRKQRFPCSDPDCDRSFTKKGNLSVHFQAAHVKVKRFVCGGTDLLGDPASSGKVPGWDGVGCGAAFTAKSSLEGHVRTQHLDLPVLRNMPVREKRGRLVGKKAKAEMVDSPMELDQPVEAHNDLLSQLTGHAYAEHRQFACLEPTCAVRFLREYDLQQHMRTKHGWAEQDLTGQDAEVTQGEQFWIGGDNDYFDNENMFQPTAMEQDGPDEFGFAGECQMFGHPTFGSNAEDTMMVDPALLQEA